MAEVKALSPMNVFKQYVAVDFKYQPGVSQSCLMVYMPCDAGKEGGLSHG